MQEGQLVQLGMKDEFSSSYGRYFPIDSRSCLQKCNFDFVSGK